MRKIILLALLEEYAFAFFALCFLLGILLLTGCAGGSGGSSPAGGSAKLSPSPSPSPTPVPPVIVSVQYQPHLGYSCVAVSGSVWCWGSNPYFSLSSSSPVLLISGPDLVLDVKQYSVCVQLTVAQRAYPFVESHTVFSGTEVLCWGASSGSNSIYVPTGQVSCVGLPTETELGSLSLSPSLPAPVEAYDYSFTQMASQGVSTYDSDSTTQVSQVSCSVSGSDLACPFGTLPGAAP